MFGLGLGALIFVFKVTVFLLSLGMIFNSAAVLGKPEGNYDAEAKLSARVVLIICIVIALWSGASLFH